MYDLVLGKVSGVRKVDDPDPRWDDVARDMQTAVKGVADTPANGKTVGEEVDSIVSSAVETRAQLPRSGKQMAKLRTPLAGRTDITTEEFVNEQKEDLTLRKAYEQVGECQKKTENW